jgi:CcmD family protein
MIILKVPDMYEFLSDHALYIVLLIVLICWTGIFGYLWRLDRKVSQLEDKMSK